MSCFVIVRNSEIPRHGRDWGYRIKARRRLKTALLPGRVGQSASGSRWEFVWNLAWGLQSIINYGVRTNQPSSARIRRCHRNDRWQRIRSQVRALPDQWHPLRTAGHWHEKSGGAARASEQGRGEVWDAIGHGPSGRRRSRTALVREASVLVRDLINKRPLQWKAPLIHAVEENDHNRSTNKV